MEPQADDPLADPVAVIVTLQQYQKKLATQVARGEFPGAVCLQVAADSPAGGVTAAGRRDIKNVPSEIRRERVEGEQRAPEQVSFFSPEHA